MAPKAQVPVPVPPAIAGGGPLAVTDCNVVLGKIQPDHFPAVFGPDGNEPLDVGAARAGFETLAEEIARETGEGAAMSVEALAEGFLRIAVENMANAIKKISVQRGYDVTQYTMNCFGGAGGQHACQVADVLGMESIFIHPFAGVLSAFGMGLADIRVIREHQFSASISETEAARKILQEIGSEARNEVLGQGVDEDRLEVVCTAPCPHAGFASCNPRAVRRGSRHAGGVRVGSSTTLRFCAGA